LRLISIGISTLCIILIILHAVFPQFAIDTTTVALIAILIFPWLLPYIKTLKLPGGIEITPREIEQLVEVTLRSAIGTTAVAARPIRDRAKPSERMHSLLFRADPNLALASLRIEIERKLKEIARRRELDVGILSVQRILDILRQQEIIGPSEFESLRLIISVCNKAVHSEEVDPKLALIVLDIGDLALDYLDSKIE
jgi:hypothetical protein